MKPGILASKVAVVAGASRGCGRGIALALADRGCTVYVTGRTTRTRPGTVDDAPGCIEDVADEVTNRGGKGIAWRVDHSDAAQVTQLFDLVLREEGRLDILACAVWGGNERGLDASWNEPFWKQPTTSWDEFIDSGPRAFWLTAHAALAIMTPKHSGLVVGISEPILEKAFEGQQSSMQDTLSHLGHYAINRLVTDLGQQARHAGIALLGLLPGFMRTERVEKSFSVLGDAARERFRYDLAESPEYTGRAVVALGCDPDVLDRAGQLLYVADLADHYGFTDVDGNRVPNFYRTLGLIP